MLEVLHLTKVYKTKGGLEVRALDDVSLKFPERGMIFLLGKSGSGKSTLLNVAGGLDAPTDGEIIVKGKSSKSFSPGDFDSYRNTFIGFIFQEYNILNEFSVEDNIAIALELQGKPKDRAAISKLLEEVDLTGYAKRKPNTLSGGQKQRIAIARALIKSPEIIMADEPTGALDSTTGKQVFDTLKKLSRDKLVIVVSHDRDFAEQYADRIIELKDGRILSDVSKAEEERREISENVAAIGDTLTIKSGAMLTEADFKEIKSFLKNTERDVVIATGERDVKTFREAAKITEGGGREVFVETDERVMPAKVFSPEDSRFIRSKLPLRHAVKIGVSGLKTKPIRLAFTALLCTVAFIMFGILSTMLFYNSEATLKQTLTDSSLEMISLKKYYRVSEKQYEKGELTHEYESARDTSFTAEEIRALSSSWGSSTFGAVKVNSSFNAQLSSSYWSTAFSGYAALTKGHPLLSKTLAGSYPDSADEIMISSYTANAMMNCKVYDAEEGSPITVLRIEELVGKKFTLDGTAYTISGIIEVPELPEKYDELLNDTAINNFSLEYELERELQDSYYCIGFVTEEKLEELTRRYNGFYSNDIFSNRTASVALKLRGEWEDIGDGANGAYAGYTDAQGLLGDVIFLSGKTAVADGEALIATEYLYDFLYPYAEEERQTKENKYFDMKGSGSYHPELEEKVYTLLIPENVSSEEWITAREAADRLISAWEEGKREADSSSYYGAYKVWKEVFAPYESYRDEYLNAKKICDALSTLRIGEVQEYGDNGEYIDSRPLTDAERRECLDIAIRYLEDKNVELKCQLQLYSYDSQSAYGEKKTLDIVGFYNSSNSYQRDLIIGDGDAEELWDAQKANIQWYTETETSYKMSADAIYNVAYVPFDRTDSSTDAIIALYENESFDENDTRIMLSSSLVDGFANVDSMITAMSQVFLWVGIVLAAFAALLLSNFISVSISQKKREIGILRAVGARGTDVFKIFFSESFSIAAVCTALSIVASAILSRILNSEISSVIGSSIFVFGPLSVVMLVAIALVTAVVATFLPVYNAARKKPVDSIRAL
ncbi:MAG: ABC transporter ATP-binding protein/permease [Clostridia bacterium]|nr:ABC transporter ATP-binding protein/permease [Clostridia bacterium]